MTTHNTEVTIRTPSRGDFLFLYAPSWHCHVINALRNLALVVCRPLSDPHKAVAITTRNTEDGYPGQSAPADRRPACRRPPTLSRHLRQVCGGLSASRRVDVVEYPWQLRQRLLGRRRRRQQWQQWQQW